jgi:flagellar assembly protein FliH
MAYAKLIAFDRALSGVTVAGQSGRFYTEAELTAREDGAYQRGVDASRALADQQMVEFRADIEQLGDGVFKKLSGVEPAVVSQLRDALPAPATSRRQR